MTKDELEMLRVRVSVEAVHVLLRELFADAVAATPGAASAWVSRFQALRQRDEKLALEGLTPEQSDQAAGEYQEALEYLLSFIESGFPG